MKDVHVVVGVLAITLNTHAAAFGGWRWWRGQASVWFWRLLRVAQGSVIVQVALGGVLVLIGHKPHGLHVLYGVLPLLVALLGEQLRVSAAQMVLDTRGYESAQEVGRASRDEQQAVVAAIIRRELGVMALALLVNVVLLARAAMTAG
jgi:hypothetical protein